MALPNERVELKCVVKARPAPKVIFWRDHEGHIPVPLGSNYEMTTDASSDVRPLDFVFVFENERYISYISFLFFLWIFVGYQPDNDDINHSSAQQ